MNDLSVKALTRYILKRSDHFEPVLFVIVAVLSTIPVLWFKYFPTLDGPAHLYNSTLIIELLRGNENIAGVFSLNSFSIPNWSGHVILSLLNSFLPAFIAQKIFIVFYILGLPIAFRMFIKGIKGDVYISWLIFPFTFSFMLYLGFYNFCFGTLLFFWGLSAWIKNSDKPLKGNFIIFVFSILIYYSHIVVFAIFAFTLFCLLMKNFLQEYSIHKNKIIKKSLLKAVYIGAALLPAAVMGLSYMLSHSSPNEGSRIPFNELLKWLYNIRSIVVFNFGAEGKYIIALFSLIIFLTIMTFTIRFYQKTIKQEQFENNRESGVIWLCLAGIIIILYFILPDEIGSGGYISVRLNWFFFIFIIVWLTKQKFYKWMKVVTIFIILFVNFGLQFYHNKTTKVLNEQAVDISKASMFIDPNSVILPLIFSNDWMTGHFSNYLGADKPLIILENYEASTGYFPVKWNDVKLPVFYCEGNDSLKFCNFMRSSQNTNVRKVDYVFFIGNNPDTSVACIRNIQEYSRKNSTLVYNSHFVSLFKCN